MIKFTFRLKQLMVATFTLAASVSANSQTFIKNIGGTGTDSGRQIEITGSGGYMTLGHTTTNSNGFADFYVVKTDGNGDTIWTKKYGGSGLEHGYSIQRLSDGNYILAGVTTSYGAGGEDAYLVKIDPNGNELWDKAYGTWYTDRIEAVEETTDGGFIAVGTTTGNQSNGNDVYLLKTDSDGDTMWTRRFGGSAFDYGNMVRQTSDGGYIIVGITYSNSASNNGDYYMIKTDANGYQQWDETFGGTGVDEAKNVQQTSDGGYIIVGDTESMGNGNSDIYMIKTDAAGSMSWFKTYGGSNKDVVKIDRKSTRLNSSHI